MAACLAMLEDEESLLLGNGSEYCVFELTSSIQNGHCTHCNPLLAYITALCYILWQRNEQQMTYIYSETHKRYLHMPSVDSTAVCLKGCVLCCHIMLLSVRGQIRNQGKA
jgi:hypothetical protein